MTANLSADYPHLLEDIKARIRTAQVRANLAVNRELILLYWEIGRLIAGRQQREGWGAGIIPRLARDLKNDLPDIKGFSERNIGRMIAFYRAYPSLFKSFLPQPGAKLGDTKDKAAINVPQAAALLTEVVWNIPWFRHLILRASA